MLVALDPRGGYNFWNGQESFLSHDLIPNEWKSKPAFSHNHLTYGFYKGVIDMCMRWS